MQYDGGNTMTTPYDLTATAPTLAPTLALTAPTTQTTSVKYKATVGVPLNYYFDTLPISWGIEIIPLPITAYQTEYGRLIYEAISN